MQGFQPEKRGFESVSASFGPGLVRLRCWDEHVGLLALQMIRERSEQKIGKKAGQVHQ